MPHGLRRYHHSSQSHFINFSCYRRTPHLANQILADAFLRSLELVRRRYQLRVYGYVVMPDHVHLLVSEPAIATLATVIQALKLSVVRHAQQHGVKRLWQKRYLDHNVRSYHSFVNKLEYIHNNPVERGLCATPLDWRWSSARTTHWRNWESLQSNQFGLPIAEQAAR